MRRGIFAGLVFLAVAAAAWGQEGAPRPPCRSLGPERKWDEAARLIAGLSLPPDSANLDAETSDAWKVYSRSMKSAWARFQREYLDPIGEWQARALPRRRGGSVALYPFGGPDAASVLAFFPDVSEYLLIGLEPAGCLPSSAAEYTPAYFQDLRKSLASAVAMGFFKTEDMRQEFRESELSGVLPVLLVELERSGYSVEDAAGVGIAPEGTLIPASAPGKREARGIEIRFRDARGGFRTLRYFSLNLENSSLQYKPGTMRYLRSLPVHGTLIKSASYLMHKRYFAAIRGAILERSAVVAQDDSGIPYQFFDAAAWDVRLHGVYLKPIRLFQNSYQQDLEAAYAARRTADPLPFVIGYRNRRSESNVLVAVRRGAGL